MIVYLDTSALIKLYVKEEGSLMLKKQLEQDITGGCWDARLWDAFKDNMDVFPADRPG